MQIDYDLIGTVPSVEKYRDTIPQIIMRWEATRMRYPKILNVAPTDELDMIHDDPKLQNLYYGLLIELCAQHFYGLQASFFKTIPELTAAMRAIEK